MSFPAPRRDFRSSFRRSDRHGFSGNSRDCHHGAGVGVAPSLKRKRSSGCPSYQHLDTIASVPSTSRCLYPVPMRSDLLPRYEREEPRLEGDVSFMSRDEIEQLSPSRKDGIDLLRETHLRYSYCAFLQNLGMRLELPQTTIGTAMVLCHRFFVRRSHACHDRFMAHPRRLWLIIYLLSSTLAYVCIDPDRPNCDYSNSGSNTKTDTTFVWGYGALPKVAVLAWLVGKKKVLTVDNLRKRDDSSECLSTILPRRGINGSSFRSLSVVKRLRDSFFNSFGVAWAMLSSVDCLFFTWHGGGKGRLGKKVWWLSLLAGIWFIWRGEE